MGLCCPSITHGPVLTRDVAMADCAAPTSARRPPLKERVLPPVRLGHHSPRWRVASLNMRHQT